MGNTNVSQKFSSLQPVALVDADKRFKFWKLYDGVFQKNVQSDNRNVSVFEFDLTEKQAKELPKTLMQQKKEYETDSPPLEKPKTKVSPLEEEPAKTIIDCARRGMKFLKTLRHPSILKYVDDVELNNSHFYIATEPVVPLRSVLGSLEMSEILLGLLQISSALNFLNDQCQITFNNVHLDSVYVTKDKQMRWMLGDFHFAMEFSNIDKEFFQNTKEIRYSETITPEEGMKKFQKYTSTCRDVYAFEKLVSKIFAEIEEACKRNNVPNEVNYQAFLKLPAIKFWMSKALESEPQSRATFASFLKLKLFEQDSLCSIMLFFDDMRLKKAIEKENFFKELKNQVNKLSISLFKKRILPRMLTLPFVTEPASTTFLAHLFSTKESSKRGVDGILSGKDYDEHILTFIRKCYISKNYSLRMRILQTLEYYQNQVPPHVAITEIIPEIMKAIKDSSNELVMFTMNACVSFSKYLSKFDQSTQSTTGIDIINNQFLPSLHHYAVQNSFPKISPEVEKEKAIESVIALRSHAVLCLLELWNLPGSNKGIILTALHSNLFDKDISELKVHALNVILIHMSRFDPRELMTYVMKPVLPLTLHEKEQVRSKATQVMKVALEYLAESDLSRCNLGMITSANDGISNVTPFFPPQSQKELQRIEIFSGQSPKHIIQFSDGEQSKTSLDGASNERMTPPVSPQVLKKEFPQEKIHEVEPTRPVLVKTASNKSIEGVVSQPPTRASPAISETEEDEWKNWSDDEEKSVPVVESDLTVQSVVVEETPQQVYTSPSPSNSGSHKKKKGLGFDSMEDDSYTPNDEEEDLFKAFTPKEQSTSTTTTTNSSHSSPKSSTTKPTPAATRGGKRKPPKSKITQNVQPTTVIKPEPIPEEEPPKESNLSKILQEEEHVDQSNWDEIDMFSEMDIKN